jgi:hypothetical protein
MEGSDSGNSDEVDGDQVNELIALTRHLERSVQDFSFTGERVDGDIESGFTVNEPPPGPPYDDPEDIE